MAKMTAMVAQAPGEGFTLVERDIPEPGPGRVRIEVEACGICHSDAFVRDGLWPELESAHQRLSLSVSDGQQDLQALALARHLATTIELGVSPWRLGHGKGPSDNRYPRLHQRSGQLHADQHQLYE